MAREVFVSYSQPDRELAFEIVARLEARGIGAWIAPRDVSPSADWAAEIIDAIAGSRVMLLVFSSSSNGSAQVRREVERAVHREIPILPFRVEDVLPSKSLEYFLSAQHWLDAFPPPREPHLERLCDALDAMLGRARGPLPAAAPAPAPAARRPAPGLAAPELARVERALAEFLGPIAGVLVRRASAGARDVAELAGRLAPELADAAERGRFLAAVGVTPGG